MKENNFLQNCKSTRLEILETKCRSQKLRYPNEWKKCTLGECLKKIVGGGTPSKTNPEFWNGSVPWATVKDLTKGDIYGTQDHITEIALKKSSTKLIPAGTVILCTRMAVGKAIRFNRDVAINQDLKALFPKNDLINSYLLVLLQYLEPQLSRLGSGSTVQGVGIQVISNVKILLPPLWEQKRIAEVLGAWDRAIALLDELIEAKKELKKGLIQQLLSGLLRFPQFGKAVKEKGKLPEGWRVTRISDIATVNPRSKRNCAEKVTVSFLGMADVSEDGHIEQEQSRIYSEVAQGFTEFQKGDILVAKITPCFENGKGAHLGNLSNRYGFGSTEFHVLRAKEIESYFLFFHTRTDSFRGRGEMNMTGSAGQKRVPADFIRDYSIYLPAKDEQQKISVAINTCDKEVSALIAQQTLLQEQKQGLMQQLLTGALRVSPGTDATIGV